MSQSRVLRDRIFDLTQPPLVLPGAPHPLTAALIDRAGFEAVYISGAGVANTHFGLPDIGFVGLDLMANVVARVRAVTDLPIVADVDTGYGNAVNAYHAVRVLEAAGVNGIQIEDQKMPKRCGHFEGKQVISAQEMMSKIQAATDARQDENLIVIARTDALAIEGTQAAVDRIGQYADAGADVGFVEAPEDRAEFLGLPERFQIPLLANIVEGGKSPDVTLGELTDAGFRIALYANSAMRAGISAMETVLRHIRQHGDTHGVTDLIASWELRQSLVGKPHFDALERRYATPRPEEQA